MKERIAKRIPKFILSQITIVLFAIYRGITESEDIDTLSLRVNELRRKVNCLRKQETILDDHCRKMSENLKQTQDDRLNQYYAYVTRDDFISVFGDDNVILTIRNFDKFETNEEQTMDESCMRVTSEWKSIDVRLVTNEGSSIRSDADFDLNDDDNVAADDDVKNEEKNTLSLSLSSSQPVRGSAANKRRHGQRATVVSESIRNEQQTINERLQCAKTILGYRPPRKHLKRNLDEQSDSFESR